MLYLRGIAVPQGALSHHHCMEQAHLWTWRTMQTEGMKPKLSRKPSKLIGSQKQQCNCEPCFAYTRALEIHALGVKKREGQNYGGNCYCAGWAGRINSFLLPPSTNQFQEDCLPLCCSPLLPSIFLLRTGDDPAHIPR